MENNYLKQEESLSFEKEMVECKNTGQDCTDIIKKYIEISNHNFRELGLDKCTNGGVLCVTREEIVQAETNVALVKHDSNGRMYLGQYLKDDDTINIVKYLNGRDLEYLKNNISTSDRVIATAMDPTSWPVMVLGTRNLILNNTKSNLTSTAFAVVINGGFQYADAGKVELTDLISAGLVNQVSAGSKFAGTANWNMLGGYYTAKVKGDEDPYYNALLSRAASQAGYGVGKYAENNFQPIFNPPRNSYGSKAWKDIGMGMSKSIPPSSWPSTIGSISGSTLSEKINSSLKKEDDK